MGAKQSTHTKKTFIHVNRSQRGSVDDSFMLDDRLTKSWHGNSHVGTSPFSSHLGISTVSIKEDEELYMTDTPENLSYAENFVSCDTPYASKVQVSGGSEVKNERNSNKTRVSLSACLDAERRGDVDQPGRTSNASSASAYSAYSTYNAPARSQVSPVGPVLLMQAQMPGPVACGAWPTELLRSDVTSPDSMVQKKKPERRPMEKERREKKTETHTVNVDDSSTWTTRMLRNLPNDYTRQDLLDLLDSKTVQYDFIYLPIDWGKRANLGYAFVNLTCPAEAEKIDTVLNGFAGWDVASEKVCEVVWGKPDQQSLRKNVERFRNSPVMHPDVPDDFKPMLFTLGRRSVFPAPTKRLRPPRGFQRIATAVEPGAISSPDEAAHGDI